MRVAAIAIFALVMAAGCDRTPKVTPAPGTAILELQVMAEPKEGVQPVDANDGTYVTAVMERVDYSTLGDMVVWLQPNEGNAPPPPAGISIEVNAGAPGKSLAAAAGVGATVELKNTGSATADFYSVSDGNEFDLGKIDAGKSGTFTIKSPGLIEILSDAVRDPVATVYGAPTPLVRVTSAGQTLEFRDLKPGSYKAFTWHPRLPGHEIAFDLPSDQIVEKVAKVGVNGLRQIGP